MDFSKKYIPCIGMAKKGRFLSEKSLKMRTYFGSI